MQRYLSIVIFAALTAAVQVSANEPAAVPENTDWNVRWQVRPDANLEFDAVYHQSPYYERLRNSVIKGESETTLQPTLSFRESNNSIAFDLKTDGESLTPTRSTTKIATVFSDSKLTCKSVLRYDFKDMRLRRTSSWISGSLENSNVRILLNNRLFSKIKTHLIMQGSGEAAKTLKGRGLKKLQTQLHEEIIQNFDAWTQWFKNGFSETQNSQLSPSGFQCRSDKQGMYGTFRMGTPGADVVPFPESAEILFEQYPIALAVEQSALNKMMQTRLGGKTVPLHRIHEFMFSDAPQETSAQDTAETPKENASENSDEENICYATLNVENPVELLATKEGVTLIIHADQFEHAQKTFPGMDIAISYQRQNPSNDAESGETESVKSQAVPCLVLDEDIRITPKQEEDGQSQRNLRAITIRRWLLNFFKRDLPKQISCDSMSVFEKDVEPPYLGQFRFDAGVIHFEDNWFFITYRLENKK